MQSFLYVIASSPDGPVKLGFSADPEKRIGQLQTGHAGKLHLFHTEPVAADQVKLYERLLHNDIGYTRVHGEWFNLTVEEAIAQVRFTFIQHEPSDLIP